MDYTIKFVWDDEANVWYSLSDDVPITLESESLDILIKRVREALPEMLELNHLKKPDNIYYLIHEQNEMVV
ncbi:MAG: DUF1902 domain-containing protein [Lachnospiraceae bacterium]|nr:DUF1902 domain-containing protein [Lachnospiraceae bacterium]